MGAGVLAWGPSTVSLACLPCRGLRAAGVVGGRPGGGGLPRLWEASGIRRCPSPGRPSLGAGSQGSATRVSRARLVWAWGPSTGPTACALVSLRCAPWGRPEGIPGGGAFRRCEGRLSSGALPPLAARPQGGLSGSATHVLWQRVCGRGGPALSLWLACPAGCCVPRGWWEAFPGGLAFHRCEGRLVSGALPATAARSLWRAARVPRHVFPGRGCLGRGDPAPGPQRALLRAVVARCGGGGRAPSGGGALRRSEGRLSSGAPPLLAARPHGRAVRVRYPRAVDAGVRAWGPSTVPLACMPCGGLHAAGVVGGRPGGWPSTVMRRVWFQALSFPRPPVPWGGQPGFRDPCFPGEVDVGVWTQHRPHSVRSCKPSVRAVGMAGGRPRGGCLAPL